jgi:hypothetical protein
MRFLIILLMFLILALPCNAFSCQCLDDSGNRLFDRPEPEKTFFEKADAVFLAKVTSTSLVNMKVIGLGDQLFEVIEARFTVIESFKNTNPPIDVVRDLTLSHPGNCAIGLVSGSEYIFFVIRDGNMLPNYVGLCTGSHAVLTSAPGFAEEIERFRRTFTK